ncbi:Oidioi.mRNA.OKI2018_I69.PAR.g13092.t1.cds [Oikopleura dioica]|uniref:Oidioi.mRNA.OKI2018_I69.PAR.g13092.t1.cds n=1 Tax=Oikopleura dioica TaxID=34765 RepID=A0ABN7S342_OIKDI|nr:Oidioi.mRNA.OKI2018_I69.PAR.g13092.t1.cds [Oikopleura dioica]
MEHSCPRKILLQRNPTRSLHVKTPNSPKNRPGNSIGLFKSLFKLRTKDRFQNDRQHFKKPPEKISEAKRSAETLFRQLDKVERLFRFIKRDNYNSVAVPSSLLSSSEYYCPANAFRREMSSTSCSTEYEFQLTTQMDTFTEEYQKGEELMIYFDELSDASLGSLVDEQHEKLDSLESQICNDEYYEEIWTAEMEEHEHFH